MLKNKHLKIVYIISLCVFATSKWDLPWFFYLIHCFLWSFIGVLAYSQNGLVNKKYFNSITMVGQLFFGSYFIFGIFTVLAYSFDINVLAINVITRGTSEFLQYTMIILSVIATSYIFKEKLLDYTFFAISLHYILMILIGIVQYGINEFVTIGLFPFTDAAYTGIKEGNIVRFLELHDIVSASGFFVIYYIIKYSDGEEKRKKYLILSILITYIGFKRIVILAVALALIIYWILKKIGDTRIRALMLMCLIPLLIVFNLYVWLIDNIYELYLLAEKFDVNFMGRLPTYEFLSEYFEYSLFYIGEGLGSAIRFNGLDTTLVQGHSDILTMFIDIGLYGFNIWLIWNFYILTVKLFNRYNKKIAYLWLVLTVFAFLTYLTGNTMQRFVFQLVYANILFNEIYREEIKKDLYVFKEKLIENRGIND